MQTQVVQILTRRSLSSSPMSVVYAHEVPILKVIRGSGAITVEQENCKQYCLQPGKVKSRDELLRLKNKYRGFVKDGQNPVDVAYPDGSRDLELYYKDPGVFAEVGVEEGGLDLTAEAKEEEIVEDDEGNSVDSEADVTDAPVADVMEALELPTAAPQIDLSDRPAVIAELDRMGVPFAKTLGTKRLADLLTNSLEPGAE